MMLLSMTSGVDSVIQFITVLLIFVFVLGVTYFTTRYVAGIQKEKYKTGNMEVIETLRISNNKYLQIVRAGNKYFCMAVCKDTVTMLGEIQKENMFFNENSVNANLNFQDMKLYESDQNKAHYHDLTNNNER